MYAMLPTHQSSQIWIRDSQFCAMVQDEINSILLPSSSSLYQELFKHKVTVFSLSLLSSLPFISLFFSHSQPHAHTHIHHFFSLVSVIIQHMLSDSLSRISLENKIKIMYFSTKCIPSKKESLNEWNFEGSYLSVYKFTINM